MEQGSVFFIDELNARLHPLLVRNFLLTFSLADFVDEDGSRIRKDESYEKNYLIGKYGAIPTLKSIDVFKEG